MSDIAKNDIYINNLKELIQNRKKLLHDKFKELNKNIKDNERLQDIFLDNLPDYENIVSDKKKLIHSLNNIVNYLDTIIEDKTLSKHKREDANREKKEIITIIKLQKKELQ